MTHILLVEDDDDVRFTIEHILLNAGHQVDSAGTVASGCELLRSRPYDLLIADGNLSDGNGGVIADQAFADGVAALIITGNILVLPDEMLSRHAVLLKPLRPLELIAAVDWAVIKAD